MDIFKRFEVENENGISPLTMNPRSDDFHSRLFLFHHFESSWDEFCKFVAEDSSMRLGYNYFYTRTGKIIPHEGARDITMTPHQVLNKTEARWLIYEYYARIKEPLKLSVEDLTDYRYNQYYLAKATKEYLLKLGQQSFTYEEVKELIESEAILNYANDIKKIVMNEFNRYWYKEVCNPNDFSCSKPNRNNDAFIAMIKESKRMPDKMRWETID